MAKTQKKHIPAKNQGKTQSKSNSAKALIYFAVAAVVITYFCFSNAIKNDFTNWDDPGYVIDNALVKSLSFDNIKAIFSTYVMGNYHPLAVLSLAIDFHFHELDPHGFHATSVFLHLINVLLVFLFVYLFSRQVTIAFITALLFGIHPMHVESVSWVAERKDLLYLLFYMASLIAYILFVKKEKRKNLFYVASILLFIFSLLSKAQAVTLPVVLLLIDYYFHRKFDKNVILEKAPFFVLSIVMGIVAVLAQKESGAIADMPTHAWYDRIFFASFSFINYIWKMVLPLNLSAYYPYPVKQGDLYPAVFYIAPIIALAVASLLLVFYRSRKFIVFGIGFYLVNIFLLLQLLPVGGSMMSERYTYLCYIGLFFIVGKSFDDVWNGVNQKPAKYKYLFAAALLVYTGYIGYKTIERNKVWNASDLLWTDVIRQHPEVVIAHNNRGSYYQKKEKLDLALKDFNEALRLKPDYPEALINRSDIHRVQGRNDLAIADCNKAIEVDKNYSGAYMNRGIALCIIGKYDEAFRDFETVIIKDPKNANVYCNRGNLYDMRGELDSALADYSMAISLNANYPDAYYNRAKTYLRKQEYDKSLTDFNMAVQLKTKNPDVYFFRSEAHKAKGNYAAALQDVATAKQMGKLIDEAYMNELKNLAGIKP